ncbi:MAG: DUF2339 domain-containing protein [Phycisphaerae bacterium]|nr:DUF2339 domain-containing protein [Phycisphaerae bacterium]
MEGSQFEQQLGEVRRDLLRLSADLARLQSRIEAIEQAQLTATSTNRAAADYGSATASAGGTIEPPGEVFPHETRPDQFESASSLTAEGASVQPPPVIRSPISDRGIAPLPPVAKVADALEVKIGGTWLNRVGAVVLLCGIGFFIKYSFEQGWLGPAARVAAGSITGLGLIAAGEYALWRSMRNFAVGLLAAGIVTLYFSTFAAQSFYHLISPTAGFALHCAITLASAGIAVHARSQAVAIMGVVGGFVTPLAFSIDRNEQIGLLTYLLVLDAGFLCVGILRQWILLRYICWLGTVLLFSWWGIQYYTLDALHVTLLFLTAFYFLFMSETWLSAYRGGAPEVGSPFYRRMRAFGHSPIVHLCNGAYFTVFYLLAEPSYSRYMGGLCLALAGLNWMAGWRLAGANEAAKSARLAHWLDGAWILALFAPIQFDHEWVVAAWGMQGVITFAFCRRYPTAWIRVKGFAVLVAAAVHLIGLEMVNESLRAAFVTFGDWYLSKSIVLSYFLVACAFGSGALLRLNRPSSDMDRRMAASVVFVGCVIFFTITASHYDRYLATCHWLGLAAFWLGITQRDVTLSVVPAAIVLTSCLKFLFFDLAAPWDDGSIVNLSGIVLNRAVITGLLVALATLVCGRFLRCDDSASPGGAACRRLVYAMPLFCALTILASGSFEIVRIFEHEDWGRSFADPRRTMHMILSVYWSLGATAILIVGFVSTNSSLRFMAITCFGLTLLKVVLVDLSYLEMVFRIVSFVVLGVLLLSASLLYQRRSARMGARGAESERTA